MKVVRNVLMAIVMMIPKPPFCCGRVVTEPTADRRGHNVSGLNVVDNVALLLGEVLAGAALPTRTRLRHHLQEQTRHVTPFTQ